ncbi:MAG: flippase-like domain-containing protein [Candidatus Nealsonbacteria bacterium]|nr:flippase-like domain-containing protein [Candidatus Nealsonbacteria bacterium]
MFGWIAGFEIFIPGIWEKTGYYITSSPAIFTLVLISPMVAFFGTAMAWKTVLSVYRCQKNPVLLLKYIIGEFAISNTIPSFGNAGRLARAALLSTQGVKVSISLSSVVIDAILSTFQTVLVMALILALGSYGIISVGGDLLLLLRVFLPSALIVLIIFLIFAKFKLKGIVKQGKITNLLLEINEGLSKIYAIPPKKMLQTVGTFAVLGYGIPEALIFTMFWRLKSIAYTVTGWILAGEGAIAAMKGFRLPINNKKMMPAEK